MGFDRYLKHKEILKTIDPGTGNLKNSNPSQLPNNLVTERENVQTPFKVIVADLIEEAQKVQLQIGSVLSNVFETNKSDAGFVQYFEMVKANHWNPSSLLTDPKSRPNPKYSPNQIKAAERDVYRRVTDIRAPFVSDLYDLVSDAGLSEYTLKRVWDRLANSNGLYGQFDETNRLPRFALYREREHINQIWGSANRINKNIPQRLSSQFLQAISTKIINKIYIAEPKEQIAQVSQVIDTLKQIKALLTILTIFNSENWEKFRANIKDIYGDFLAFAANKAAKTQSHSIIGGIQDLVLDFTEDFEDFLPFGLSMDDIPELRELRSQIDMALAKNLERAENDLVYREGIQIKLEESRQLLILNSRKNNKTKQYLETLDSIIFYLEELKLELSNLSGNVSLDTDYLTFNLSNKLDQWLKTPAKTQPKSVKTESDATLQD